MYRFRDSYKLFLVIACRNFGITPVKRCKNNRFWMNLVKKMVLQPQAGIAILAQRNHRIIAKSTCSQVSGQFALQKYRSSPTWKSLVPLNSKNANESTKFRWRHPGAASHKRRILASLEPGYDSPVSAGGSARRTLFSDCHSPIGSVSSLTDIKEAPGTVCLMVKWILEKIGGESSALKCYVPAVLPISNDNTKRDFLEGWLEAHICFGSHPSKALRDAFRQAYDERLLRWGRLIEVVDCFAGDIAYHYCTPHEEGYSKLTTLMVTASIDRMEFNDVDSAHAAETSNLGKSRFFSGLNVEEDLSMIGCVTQSGSSSMGIRIEMQQGGIVKGSVFFVMVAVNELGEPQKKVPVLDVSSCSPKLQSLIAASSAGFQARKAMAKKNLLLVPPDPEESCFLHETWKKSRSGGDSVVWMRDTLLESTELIQPEALSRYNRAFGGLIARKALELSYLNAQCFLGTLKPILKGIDDIFFLKPLYVGDMLRMTAMVQWSTPTEIQIQVEVSRCDPLSGARERTNLVNLRYDTLVRDSRGAYRAIAPPVYPQDYADCIAFLEARRRSLMRNETQSTS